MNYLASNGQLRASLLRWSLFTVPLLFVLGFFSARVAGGGPGDPWFDNLVKPAFYPPPLAFPIVWGILYALMGVSLAMILSARGAIGRGLAVIAFVIQFALNFSWSPVFFGMHLISAGLWIAVAMGVAALITTVLFWRIRPVAGMLLLPYLAWICVACALSFEIGRLNPQADGAFGSPSTVRVEI